MLEPWSCPEGPGPQLDSLGMASGVVPVPGRSLRGLCSVQVSHPLVPHLREPSRGRAQRQGGRALQRAQPGRGEFGGGLQSATWGVWEP